MEGLSGKSGKGGGRGRGAPSGDRRGARGNGRGAATQCNRGGGRLHWIAAAAAVLAAVLTFDSKLYINGDNAEYLRMGERVLTGDLWPSSKYPPLFPYLLAPLLALFGRTVLPAKILVLLTHAGAAAFLVPVFARRFPGLEGALLLFVALTAVPVLEFSHYVMSEIPFLLTLAATVAVADRWLARTAVAPAETGLFRGLGAVLGSRWAWILAASLAAGFYVRSAGAAVWAALVLVLSFAGRRREAAGLVVLLALFALPWLLHSLTSPGGNPYLRQFLLVNPYYPEFGTLDLASLGQRLVMNAREYFREILPLGLLPLPYRSTYSPLLVQKILLPLPIALTLVALLLVGIGRGLWRRDVVAWCVALSLVLVLLWPPIWAGSRFLVPFLPLCFLLVAEGARTLAALPGVDARLRPSLRLGLGRMLLVFFVVVALFSIVKYERETEAYPPEWGNYFAGLEWLRAHAPADALVIDRKPVFVDWVAGRAARTFPREPDPAKMLVFLRESGADYLVYPSLPYDDISRYLVPAVAALDDYLSVEAVFGGSASDRAPLTFVFRFHPEGGQNALRPPPAN